MCERPMQPGSSLSLRPPLCPLQRERLLLYSRVGVYRGEAEAMRLNLPAHDAVMRSTPESESHGTRTVTAIDRPEGGRI